MNKLTSLFVISLFCGIHTFAQTPKVDSSSMVTLRIDPENARGATVSQLFNEVEFIPLETTNESLFGKISQIKITQNEYVIYDFDTKAVLIFSKSGKYMAKINASMIKSDGDPKEVGSFYGFRMAKNGTQDQIMIFSAKNVYFFDMNGKLIQKKLAKEYPTDTTFPFAEPNELIKPNFLKVNGKDSIRYEIAVFNKEKESALYFPYAIDRYKYDQFFSSGSNSSRIFKTDMANEYFYLRYYDLNIYKITPEKLSLTYRIILPATISLPKDFMTNESYKNKRMEYFQKNTGIIYGITDTYRIGNFLYFKLSNLGFGKGAKNGLIYNLGTGELTSIKDIEPDQLSSYLPVTDAGAFYDYYSAGIHVYQDENFYTSYSSLAMFTFKDQSAGKNPQYNAVLANYFKTQNKKSNPVLIRLKPKKN